MVLHVIWHPPNCAAFDIFESIVDSLDAPLLPFAHRSDRYIDHWNAILLSLLNPFEEWHILFFEFFHKGTLVSAQRSGHYPTWRDSTCSLESMEAIDEENMLNFDNGLASASD